MEPKRLSLSNLHEQIDSLKSSEWPTMKRYFRRQIVKCINECKTQACNAKKLVENIKDHGKNKGANQSDDDEDDDVGWGSDFDDEDESEDNEDFDKEERLKVSHKYEIQREDQLYEPVSDYMSGSVEGIGFKLNTDENLEFNNLTTNVTTKTFEFRKAVNENHNENNNGLNNDILRKSNDEIHCCDKSSTCSSNGVKGVSPKPIPRVMPKPPSTKPEVPKNKPQIIPRKPFTTNGSKPLQTIQTKRPPSEPPPPPLPKSPPPTSPLGIARELDSIFSETLSLANKMQNQDEDTYESIVLALVPEDEYLPPIRPEISSVINRQHSSSTISNISNSTRDGDSPLGAFHSFSPQGSASSKTSLSNNSTEDDYEPFNGMVKAFEPTQPIDNNDDSNYEIVDDHKAMLNGDNHLNCSLPMGERPLLPKVNKSTTVSNGKKTLIPDVFPTLPPWSRSLKDKKPVKDKNDIESNIEDNGSQLCLDSINNNTINNHHNSIGISARPLPPLPPLPAVPTFVGNDSIRSFPWFHSVEREDAEALLMTQDQDGAYLVRESKRAGKINPYTLTIFHDGRVFHLNIRKRPDALYALGKDKPREKTFKTVADLVSYHTMEPILLTTRGTPAGKTRLVMTPMS